MTPKRDAIEDHVPFAPLRELRDVSPPPSLVAAIMRRVAEPEARGFMAWLRGRHIHVRLSPLGLAGACALGAAVLFFATRLGRAPAPAPVITVVPETPTGAVMVRFVLTAKGARHVTLAGTFNDWAAGATRLEDPEQDGTFVATVSLPAGTHEYMFLVDGRWVTDPAAEERRPDGFGRENALLRL